MYVRKLLTHGIVLMTREGYYTDFFVFLPGWTHIKGLECHETCSTYLQSRTQGWVIKETRRLLFLPLQLYVSGGGEGWVWASSLFVASPVHYVWFSQFWSHFRGTMHCLPQRLKSTFFEIFSNGAALKGPALSEKIFSKNVDFSL